MMRAVLTAVMITALAVPAWADARMTVLVDVLKLSEVTQILVREDQEYAEELNRDMLDGKGGAAWQVQVDAVLSRERMIETVRRALAKSLEGEMLEEVIEFYSTDLGSRIIQFENSGRVAIGDPDIEEAARGRYIELQDTDDARLGAIRELVADGDMINLNISGALNANYQFLRGLSDGGGIKMSEQEILEDVASQTDQITEDTTIWLFGFLLLAYSPLTNAEMQTYLTFSTSEAGQALNFALFEGFGDSYEDISYGLGRTVALNMTAQEL